MKKYTQINGKEIKICPFCKEMVLESDNYCSKCGEKLK